MFYDMKCDLPRIAGWDFYVIEQAVRAGEVDSADYDFLRRAAEKILTIAADAEALLDTLDEVEDEENAD